MPLALMALLLLAPIWPSFFMEGIALFLGLCVLLGKKRPLPKTK